MANLTEYEKIILKDITNDDFYEEELDSHLWADVFIDGCSLPNKVARGVLGSLVKKGILNGIDKGRDGQIYFTEYGKEVMKNLEVTK